MAFILHVFGVMYEEYMIGNSYRCLDVSQAMLGSTSTSTLLLLISFETASPKLPLIQDPETPVRTASLKLLWDSDPKLFWDSVPEDPVGQRARNSLVNIFSR